MSAFTFADGKGGTAKKAGQHEAGKKIFETNCVACHGSEGKGDGAAAAALTPKPRNFTDAVYMKKRPLDSLRAVISNGGASMGLSPTMIAWNGILKPDEIESVLQYVLSFSKPQKAKKTK